MVKLILTIGIPGSGKSTWAREGASDEFGLSDEFIVVERDEIRKELTGDIRDHSREMEVTRIQHARARALLGLGVSVIVADTNLKAKYRNEWMKIAADAGVPYYEKCVMTPVETCIERDAERLNPVGREVIVKMHAQLLQTVRGGRTITA